MKETADKNKLLNQTLPIVELDTENQDTIQIDKKIYTLTDETVEYSSLKQEIAVNIKNKYYVAVNTME